MKMKRIIYTIVLAFAAIGSIYAASPTKPRVMIRPAEIWCTENGFMTRVDNLGEEEAIPEYEKAFQSNGDLHMVMTKIRSMMNDRGYDCPDFLAAVRDVKNRMARRSGTTSRTSGSSIATSFADELASQAKADIYFDVYWSVRKNGPKSSIAYTLSAIDPYTLNSFADVSGVGQPSFSADIPQLLEEAVVGRMDAFLAQFQTYFDKCREEGRPISLEIATFDNGSGIDMETEFGGRELRELIEDWVAEHTVNNAYNLVDDTETSMHFQDVRIPLFDERERPANAGTFGRELRSYLTSMKVPSKQGKRTLASYEIIIGEK